MIDNKITVPRAYTYEDLARKKYKTLPLKGGWKEYLGEIEKAGSILIYGDSGHGKTTYALQLMRPLAFKPEPCKHLSVACHCDVTER